MTGGDASGGVKAVFMGLKRRVCGGSGGRWARNSGWI